MASLVIAVRRPAEADAAALSAVHDAAWLEAYRGILPGRELSRYLAERGPEWWRVALERSRGMLVLEVGGVVAGYVAFGLERQRGGPVVRGEIRELYVDPAHQGLGFGRRLFAAAREELNRRGCAGLIVWALGENERAAGFYRRLGGRAVARVDDVWGGRKVARVAFLWG